MKELWTATDEFAAAWIASPHKRVFRDGLKPTPHDMNNPFQVGSVQQLLVEYSTLQSQPLLLGKRVRPLPEFARLYQASAEVQAWLEAAERFAVTLIQVIEFLRSRLPGYPSILAPDLLPGAPRVNADGFWDMRFPWELGIRGTQLQFSNEPALLARALDLPDGGRRANAALSAVGGALRRSDSWKRFAAAHSGLSSGDREAAKVLRREYRDAVSEARVDEVAGRLAIRSQSMRRGELERIKDSSVGSLREYYEAFDAVDELIEAVAALVSHRVAKGDIDELPLLSADWGAFRDLRSTRIQATDNDFRHPYDLVKVSAGVGSLGGIVLLRNLTIHIGENVLVADGRLLAGSADVPAAASATPPARPAAAARKRGRRR